MKVGIHRLIRMRGVDSMLQAYVEQTPPVTETVSGGMSKVERYRWLSRNKKGELAYVDKRSLLVDHTYQRPFNDAKRLRIAARFNWAAFGVLLVVRRRDGSLWTIDGQHRLAAAMSRADIQDVPVIVFDLEGRIEDEATDFLVANKERKPLSGVESFKAMVVSGDPTAAIVKELVESIGREVGPAGAGCVACPHAIYKCVQTDVDALRRIWPVVAQLCEGAQFDNRLIQAIFTLERRLIDGNGERLSFASSPALRQKLIDAGFSAILRAIGEASAYHKRGGETVWARGVLNILNHRRQRRMTLTGDKLDS